MRSFIISFLMYLHQLPQNIIGFLLILYYKGEDEFVWQGKERCSYPLFREDARRHLSVST